MKGVAAAARIPSRRRCVDPHAHDARGPARAHAHAGPGPCCCTTSASRPLSRCADRIRFDGHAEVGARDGGPESSSGCGSRTTMIDASRRWWPIICASRTSRNAREHAEALPAHGTLRRAPGTAPTGLRCPATACSTTTSSLKRKLAEAPREELKPHRSSKGMT